MDNNGDKQKILEEEKVYTKYEAMDRRSRDASHDSHMTSQQERANLGFTSGDDTTEPHEYRGSDFKQHYQSFEQSLLQQPDDADRKSAFSKPSYSNRKTMSQGAMDFALLMSNLAQLVVLLDVKGKDNTVVIKLLTVLTILSIILQAIVAIMLTVLAQMKIRNEQEETRADRMNEATSVLILIVSIINVINSSMQIERNGNKSEAKGNRQPISVIVANSTDLLKEFGKKAGEMLP